MPMRIRHSLPRLLAVALVGCAVWTAPASATVDATPRATVVLEYAADATQPFRLSTPRPNPFQSTTTLELTLDQTTNVTVAVYDALGRQVALLHEGTLRPATYTLRVEAGDLPPGLYLVRATDGRGTTATRSVSLVR